MDKYDFFSGAKSTRERLARAATDDDYDAFMAELQELGRESMHGWLRGDLLCGALGMSQAEATVREVVKEVVMLFNATPLTLVTDENGDKVTYEYGVAAEEAAIRDRELSE